MSIQNNSLPSPTSKPDFVRQGFDSIAGKYDRLNDLMTAGLHRRWKKEAVQRLRLKPGMRLLDFCSGTGDLAYRAIHSVGSNGQVVALDFSQQMMAAGRRRSIDKEQKPSWLCGDAMHLPFPDETFDAACVGFGLRNVSSIETTLRDVFRVLRPGAWFVNLDTARAEWPVAQPFYNLYMSVTVPLMGKFFAGSREMYAYLSSSAAGLPNPAGVTANAYRRGFYQHRICLSPAHHWRRSVGLGTKAGNEKLNIIEKNP